MKKITKSNLFDGQENDSSPVILLLSKVNLDNSTGKTLMRLSKEDIYSMIEPLRKVLYGRQLKFVGGSNDMIERLMTEFVRNGQANLLKEDIANIYLSFSYMVINVFSVANSNPCYKACWEKIVRSAQITSEEIEAMIGRKMIVCSSRSWTMDFFTECLFYPLEVVKREYERNWGLTSRDGIKYTFSMPSYSREFFAKWFLGKSEVEPEVVEELPGEGLRTVGFEGNILSDLTYLSALAMTVNPLSEARGTLSAAWLKTMKQDFQTGEFPLLGREYPLDRIEMLAYAFFSVFKRTDKRSALTDPGFFAKKVLEYIPQLVYGPQFEIFLPEFKGFSKSWTETSHVWSVTQAAYNVLAPAANGWMSMSNFRLRYLCSDNKEHGRSRHYESLFSDFAIDKNTLKRRSDELKSNERCSANIDWFEEVDFPFVLHWLEFLCAMGMVEIAYAATPEPDGPLQGMRYVRLTPLGRYAMGYDSEYKVTGTADTLSLEYDDSNCIVTVLSDNCPYSYFLRQISLPIGSSRFKITAESIMKGCAGPKAYAERKDNLRRIVDVDKAVNLQRVLEEAQKRTECVEKVKGDYTIMRINRQLPQFASMLAANKEIRENCILAEKSMIVVKNTFIPRFKVICSKYGYIADI